MAADWMPSSGAVASLALVVAFSPLPVLALLVLMLQTARPRWTGVAFAAARVLSLAALTVWCTRVPNLVDTLDRPLPSWTNAAGLVFGVVLITFGVWRWRRRGPSAWASRMWDWIATISPVGAAVLGVASTILNGKALVTTAAAGYVIGTAELGLSAAVAAILFYTLVASSTIIAPVVAYAIAAEQIHDRLHRVKAWIERHQAAVTALTSLVIGVALVVNGLRGHR